MLECSERAVKSHRKYARIDVEDENPGALRQRALRRYGDVIAALPQAVAQHDEGRAPGVLGERFEWIDPPAGGKVDRDPLQTAPRAHRRRALHRVAQPPAGGRL